MIDLQPDEIKDYLYLKHQILIYDNKIIRGNYVDSEVIFLYTQDIELINYPYKIDNTLIKIKNDKKKLICFYDDKYVAFFTLYPGSRKIHIGDLYKVMERVDICEFMELEEGEIDDLTGIDIID